MADLEFDMGDPQVNKNDDSDSDSTASDWDVDSEEEEMKKQAKAAAKAEKEEQERLQKEREEATKRRNAERKEAERKKKEAKLAELNRLKSPEELKEEEEAREMDEADDFLGCSDDKNAKEKAEDRLAAAASNMKISAPIITNTENDKPSLFNFTPKNPSKMTRSEALTLAGFLTDKLFEYKDDPNFIVVVDQLFRQTANKHEDEDWEKIRQFGKTVSAISNEKQQAHKKKTEKKKRGGKKPKQAKARDDDFAGDMVEDDFDGFM